MEQKVIGLLDCWVQRREFEMPIDGTESVSNNDVISTKPLLLTNPKPD